jgi:hypothetical protein
MNKNKNKIHKGSENLRPRKSRYSPKYITKVEKWTSEGLTLEEVARRIGVSVFTIHLWRAKYTPFNNAFKKGRENQCETVVASLFKSACGYEVEEKTVTFDGNQTMKGAVVSKRHVAPNVGAAAFLLKNLKYKEWKDRHEENEGTTVVINVPDHRRREGQQQQEEENYVDSADKNSTATE